MNANILRGHLDLILLATLEAEPLYGLRIIQEVERQTEGAFRFKEGTLYPALHRLERQGWLSTRIVPSQIGGPPRKEYFLTEDGVRELSRQRDSFEQFNRAMRPFGGRHAPQPQH